jgi:hypothetical protein
MSGLPATLPHANNAIIPERKITGYLLDVAHPKGGPKARFFLGHGYVLSDWRRLASDLRNHGIAYAVTGTRPTVGGINYEVTGSLAMPDGSTAAVVTVWYIADGSMIPQLATAFPAKRR